MDIGFAGIILHDELLDLKGEVFPVEFEGIMVTILALEKVNVTGSYVYFPVVRSFAPRTVEGEIKNIPIWISGKFCFPPSFKIMFLYLWCPAIGVLCPHDIGRGTRNCPVNCAFKERCVSSYAMPQYRLLNVDIPIIRRNSTADREPLLLEI